MPNMMIRSDVEMSPSPFRSYMALALVTGCMKNDSKFNKSLKVMIEMFGLLRGRSLTRKRTPLSARITHKRSK